MSVYTVLIVVLIGVKHVAVIVITEYLLTEGES